MWKITSGGGTSNPRSAAMQETLPLLGAPNNDEHSTARGTEYGTARAPSPDAESWLRVALTVAAGALSIPTFVAGIAVMSSTIGAGGGPITAFGAILSGNAVLAIIGAVMGTIGARAKVSSYMLTNVAFGRRHAVVVNLVFAASLLGWFGVNAGIFCDATYRLLEEKQQQREGGNNPPVPIYSKAVIHVLAGSIMTITAIRGFRFISALSAVLVPILGIVTVLLIYRSLTVRPIDDLLWTAAARNEEDASKDAGGFSFGSAVSLVVGTAIIGAIILPDLTRFIRTWSGAVYASFVGYAVVGSIVEGAGGLASFAFGEDDLSDVFLAAGLGYATPVIIIAGTWVLNSLNLYSASLSVMASLPRFESKWLTAVLGAVGTVFAALFDVLSHSFVSFLLCVTIVFTPVAGVVAVDYFMVKKDAYTQDGSERDQRGLSIMLGNGNALVAWAIGAAFAVLGSVYDFITLTGMVAIDAVIAAGLIYFLLRKCSPEATTNS